MVTWTRTSAHRFFFGLNHLSRLQAIHSAKSESIPLVISSTIIHLRLQASIHHEKETKGKNREEIQSQDPARAWGRSMVGCCEVDPAHADGCWMGRLWSCSCRYGAAGPAAGGGRHSCRGGPQQRRPKVGLQGSSHAMPCCLGGAAPRLVVERSYRGEADRWMAPFSGVWNGRSHKRAVVVATLVLPPWVSHGVATRGSEKMKREAGWRDFCGRNIHYMWYQRVGCFKSQKKHAFAPMH